MTCLYVSFSCLTYIIPTYPPTYSLHWSIRLTLSHALLTQSLALMEEHLLHPAAPCRKAVLQLGFMIFKAAEPSCLVLEGLQKVGIAICIAFNCDAPILEEHWEYNLCLEQARLARNGQSSKQMQHTGKPQHAHTNKQPPLTWRARREKRQMTHAPGYP